MLIYFLFFKLSLGLELETKFRVWVRIAVFLFLHNVTAATASLIFSH